MIDILFPVHNRREFTEATALALAANTPRGLVRQVYIYDDASVDGAGAAALEILRGWFRTVCRVGKFDGPVAIMNNFLTHGASDIFAKVDNDTMVPTGWLETCLAVLERHPELDLLGIEAMTPVEPSLAFQRSYQPAAYIGGIGLMRRRAFTAALEPNGYFGFTAYQDQHPEIRKGWLYPALPVCLLDRVPVEPWCTFSTAYVASGWQRPWPPYTELQSGLWGWFV